jgi:uncharacterized protein
MSDTLDRIRAIRKEGKQVQYELRRFGLPSREAFELEAAAMQLLDLKDLLIMVSGHHVQTRGRVSVDVAKSLFDAPPAPPIAEPSCSSRSHSHGTGDPGGELLEVTAGWWVLGPRRERARYAFAIQRQVIRQVYEIAIGSWRPQGPEDRGWTGKPKWGFTGTVATNMDQYRNTNVRNLYTKGEASPIEYCNC